MPECESWQCINSFAPWVSAIGTLLISGLALWLAIKDRRINLKARLSLGVLPGQNQRVLNRRVFVLSFTNNGYRKVTVTNHCWKIPFRKGISFLMPNLDQELGPLCTKIPVELDDGQEGHAFYDERFFLILDNPEGMFFPPNKFIAWVRIYLFRAYICTTVGKRVKVSIDRAVRRKLWGQCKERVTNGSI